MKTISIILVIIIIGVLGYFVFVKDPSNVIAPETEQTESTGTNTSSEGKLDINVVCESALSYMSFPDGESAAQFVAECKEGKHPEVIEKHKTDMNLGDGTTI